MKQIDFEHGKITDNILRASIPMLVAEVLSLLYNIVDRIYIARIPDVGTTALGAVGLCFPIITIILAFSNLFGSGGAPLFSIARGRKDTKEASMIMNTSFFLICVCALLLMTIGMIFAKPILILFGGSESGLIYAYPYLMIYLLGTFPSMVSTGMNPFINAQGYATTGMLSVAIGAVANLILDPVFIFVFALGIRGAAIATVLSQTLSAAFVLYFLRKKTELKVCLLGDGEAAYEEMRKAFFQSPEAEKMNEQAQNALLKTIEEPPEYGVVILLTSNITALLPTIQSRCLIMEFRPLSNSIVEEFLRTQGQVPDYLAKASAAFAQGNLGKAMRYAKSEDFIETKDMILNLLRHVQDMTVNDMLENIKELGTRKDEVRDYIDLMELWYRDVLIFKATKNINQLIFQDESTNIAKEASLRGYEQIEHIMQAFEKAKVRLKAYVNFEVTLELMLMALKD